MQALLHGAGLCFISKGTQLNTPDRAVLHDPARHRKLLAQALLILLRPRLVAYCAHGQQNYRWRWRCEDRHGASGRRWRSGRHITLNGAVRGHWRCWRGAGGSRRGGCRWFATLQHAVVQGVGAPRKPPLFTGAPTLSAGVSVLLLIGRTSVGAGWLMPAASPPSRFGRAGRA